MTEPPKCDWCPEHGPDNTPKGPSCGAPATHRILWLDGTRRYSFGCERHLAIDADATPHKIEAL